MELYLVLKVVHIVSATLLFGTGLGTAFYLFQAHRTHDPKIILAVSRNVVLADAIFTAPAVIIQPITGVWMMDLVGYEFTHAWIIWSIILYLVAGACWLPVLWIQIRIKQLALLAVSENKSLPSLYHQYMRYWIILGWPAFLSVLAIFWLMVARPG